MLRFPTLVVAACLCVHTASAATFCATSSAQLQSALTSAASNNQDDTIRVATGNYSVMGSNQFEFFPAASDQDNDLQIIGGWTPFFGNSCGELLLDDASLTVLDGNNAARVLDLFPPETGDVTIRNLTFTNGTANDTVGGGGLLILQSLGDTYNAAMTIENNIFLSNSSPSSGALRLTLSGGSTIAVRLLNNMFVGNEASGLGRGAATISVNSDDPPGGPVLTPLPLLAFAHNTVLNNLDTGGQQGDLGGIWLTGDVRNVYAASNNLWGNSGDDLNLGLNSVSTVILRNNNIQDLATSSLNPPDVDEGNISVEPEYESCGVFCVERVPVPDSPLIDSGFAPGGFTPPWSLPASDLRGAVRVADQGVDIGAYEGRRALLFRDRFEDN